MIYPTDIMPPGSHGPVRADITRVDVVQSYKFIMSWHKYNKVVVTIWLREQKLYSTIHPLTQVYPPFVFHQVTVIRTAHEIIPVPQGGCHNWALRLPTGRVNPSTHFRQDSEMAIYPWAHSKSCSKASSQAQGRNPWEKTQCQVSLSDTSSVGL